MKLTKSLSIVVLVAAAVMAFAATNASATTLETNGSARNETVNVFGNLVSGGTTTVIKDTAGFSKNECGLSELWWRTSSPYTGSSVTGALEALAFGSCTRTVTVHTRGSLEVTYTSGTNGTVASEGAEVTVGSAIGTLTCKTGATTNIGTLTGVGWPGTAVLDVNAVLNCGIIPSAKWEGAYELAGVTHAWGVVA